jgi:signal peptidase I
MKSFARELLITVGLAIVIFLLLQTTIQSSIVDGSSMQPGLEDGQRLIVVKAVYHFKQPDRGDIIIIHPPVAPQKQWVKRVIGIPGDTVEVKGGTVYVNNIPLDEPYIKDIPRYTFSPYKVPDDNYFVMGDNRNNSTDSHYGWTVEKENIVGAVWLRIWPLSEWGVVPNYPLSNGLKDSGPNGSSANWVLVAGD